MDLHPKKKVEIVVDAAATDRVVALLERAGAKGYTVVRNVSGKGVRGVRTGHDIFEEAQNALVVAVVPADVAERVMRDVVALLEATAGIATVSDVLVARDDHF